MVCSGALAALDSSTDPPDWKKDTSRVLKLLEFEAEAMALSSKANESEELKRQLPTPYTRNTHDALGLLSVSETSEDDTYTHTQTQTHTQTHTEANGLRCRIQVFLP